MTHTLTNPSQTHHEELRPEIGIAGNSPRPPFVAFFSKFSNDIPTLLEKCGVNFGNQGEAIAIGTMSRHTGFQQIGEDDSSVAPSRGVSDITGIELGSVMSGEVGFIMS